MQEEILPIGTVVTIKNCKKDYGSLAGKKKTITGYTEWRRNPRGGYICDRDGEKIFLNEDFISWECKK